MWKKIYIFAVTTTLCVVALYFNNHIFHEELELDLLSHLFGGMSVMIVLNELSVMLTRSINIRAVLLLLIVSVMLFEVVEHISLCTILSSIYSDYNYFNTYYYWYDTITDIIVGIFGGALILFFGVKYEKSKI